MKKTDVKLYNMIFPIWLLWLIPITWIVILPGNFIIDLLVLVLTMKYLKIQDIKMSAKSVIFKVWIFGFIADFMGMALMILAAGLPFSNETAFEKWWYHNITNSVSFNPFENIYALLYVTICVILTAAFIYLFNYKFCLKKLNLSKEQKQKIALSLAIFTAPYLFYLPTDWFY